MYWRIKKVIDPKNPNFKTVKWGEIRKDNTLKVPNSLTLKWILPYYRRMTEKQVVGYMYALTAFFCLIGLIFDIVFDAYTF